jgi:hypothetical protein
MSQQQRILELVKSGSITVEQGMELLKTLEGTAAPRVIHSERPVESAPPRPPKPPHPPKPPRPAWRDASSAARVGRPLASGGGQLNFDQIVQLGMYGIKPEYVQEMRDAGLEDLDFDTVVQLGMYGVKPKYVLEIRQIASEMGAEPPSTQKIIELGMYNVRPEYVRGMMQTGLGGMDVLGEETPEERQSAKRANLKAKRAKLEAKQEQLEAKRDKIQAKLERGKNEREREKLQEMLEETNDELESLADDLNDLTEREIEAGLDDDEPEAPKVKRSWFDINTFIDRSMPTAVQRAALEEAMQTVSADLERAEDAAERAALTEVQKQISEELGKLSQLADNDLELAMREATLNGWLKMIVRGSPTPTIRKAALKQGKRLIEAKLGHPQDDAMRAQLNEALARFNEDLAKLEG